MTGACLPHVPQIKRRTVSKIRFVLDCLCDLNTSTTNVRLPNTVQSFEVILYSSLSFSLLDIY